MDKEPGYRDNAVPPTDKVAIEKERLRQKGETERHRIETMGNGLAAWRICAVAGLFLSVWVGSCTVMHTVDKKYEAIVNTGECRDELLAFGSTGLTMHCNHPEHVGTPHDRDRLFCKCSPSAASQDKLRQKNNNPVVPE
jgi:hypothetical protein